jgi:deoxyadenosine/deoxycytidine kinase
MRRSHPEYIFIDEPVEFWESLKNEENESLLEVFYADQRRWSYTFQNCALLSRFKNIENTVNKKKVEIMNKLKMNNVLHGSSFKPLPCVFITERCLETDKEVFAKLLFGSKQLDMLEYKLYETWYNLISEKATKLSAIVYVDTLPDLCADRIKIRSRDGESSIPKEYLCALHEQQDSWI